MRDGNGTTSWYQSFVFLYPLKSFYVFYYLILIEYLSIDVLLKTLVSKYEGSIFGYIK